MSADKNYIACRVCERVFLSTKDLINHLDSHLMSEEDIVTVRRQIEISHLMSAHHPPQTPNLFWNPALIQPGLPATNTARSFYPSQQFQPYFNHTGQFYSPVQAPPVPYSNHFNVLPNSYRKPNPISYPNTQASPSATRAQHIGFGFGSRFGAPSLVPMSSQQATPRMPAIDGSRDSGFGALSLAPSSQQAPPRMPARDDSRDSGFGELSLEPPSQQATPGMPATEDSHDFTRPFLVLLDYPIPKMNSNCNENSSKQLDLTLKL